MPKAPGSGSLWTKIKSIKDFKESYIEHIAKHIEDALKIKVDHLKNGNENLKAGAANFYISEWNKLEKEFRNTEPQDLAKKKSAYDKHKKELAKKEKAADNNMLDLDDFKTGTR